MLNVGRACARSIQRCWRWRTSSASAASRRLRKLWLPALAPFLLSGARLGLSLAWKVIVLVEMFGMSSGVGYQLNQAFSTQDVSLVLAWTLLFAAAMAVLEYGLLRTIERRVTRWRRAAIV